MARVTSRPNGEITYFKIKGALFMYSGFRTKYRIKSDRENSTEPI